jgi:site-specific recombinase XerD
MAAQPLASNARRLVVPAPIAGAADRNALRFLEYFTVNIRNKNTRAAYARAATDFLHWCEGRGIGELRHAQPVRKLGPGAMSRTDVWRMVHRRSAGAGIRTAIGCHTFRATGITDYLTNGGWIEVAQRMAGHSNAKTTASTTGATTTSAWAKLRE